MSNKKSIHLIKNIEFITCPYCNKKSQLLHWKHLKSHNKKLEDVRSEFSDHPTMTQCEYNRRLEVSKMGRVASKETLHEIKNVKCFYCDNEKKVPKNHPNKFVCDECLKEGKEYIDGRKKNKAKLKRIETNVEKYGENYIDIQHQKSMKTQNEKFNGKIGFANTKIKEKIESINLEKYGSENYMKSKKAMENYSSPSLIEGVREKISKKLKGRKSKFKNKTYEEIYGKEKSKKLLKLKHNIIIKKFIPKLKLILEYLNLELIDEYINSHSKIKFKCKKCNNIFEQIWNKIQQGYTCPLCYPRNQGFSKYEKEIEELIFNNMNIIKNSRDIISPQELDIYIPSKNIAIEFDGLYWHSEEQGKDKNYHLNKTEECLKHNIRLIHIFEDEWIYKKDIVKSRLKQILGLNDSKRIHARKCKIKEISPKIKNEFLENYHIQGSDNSNIKLGAFYNDELVSIMTFSKGNISKGSSSKKYIFELNRFCSNSNYHIPGIASKLLTHFKRNYKWKEIFSYADIRWSDGNLYHKLGFELEYITKSNYWYIKNLNRIHRFNLRKRPDEPKDIPEWVLRQKEGYYRIWDCGHYKFRMTNKDHLSGN